ncbi:MAG: hypothetical protein M1840_009126 [Geoglossum simile]|nr:MAG: hypothetical protein M1840_009126 [Geoglossum simile]
MTRTSSPRPQSQRPITGALSTHSLSASSTVLDPDAAPPAPSRWGTLALSNELQAGGFILGVILATFTIYYSVKTYRLAKWTAFKDDYEWCENEVHTHNRAIARCIELLKTTVPPPPYVKEPDKRWFGGDFFWTRRNTTSNSEARNGPASLGALTVLFLSVAILVCIIPFTRLARLGRLRPTSILEHHCEQKVSSPIQVSPCTYSSSLATLPTFCHPLSPAGAPGGQPPTGLQ